MMSCKQFQDAVMEQLPGTDFSTLASMDAAQAHLQYCETCREELSGMDRLMHVMEDWQAPEPNPYFMTRMSARLAEERSAPVSGRLAQLWHGLQARMTYGQRWRLQPVLATALSLLVITGGSAYLGFVHAHPQPVPAVITASPAVVQDLQNLDTNSTALDTLENLTNNAD